MMLRNIVLKISLIFLLIPAIGHSATVYSHNFNDGTFGGASHGSFWSIQNSGGIGGSAYARCTYSVAGTAGKAIIIPVSSYTTNILWIEFYTRATSNVTGGSKFIKLFGYDQANSSNDSANNLTLILDYNSNVNYRVVYFGDSSCAASWAGGNGYSSSKIEQLVCGDVQHPVTGGSIDIRGSDWDHYKVLVRRANSGQTNGEVKVWWNGNLHAHITIMPSNPNYSIISPYLKRIEIGGYNSGQDGHFNGDTWYLDVDDLYVGTTEKDSTTPDPIPGSCGVADGGSFDDLSAADPRLCVDGGAELFSQTETSATWQCPGQFGGTPAYCSATITPEQDCSEDFADMCTESECAAIGFNYCSGECQVAECPTPVSSNVTITAGSSTLTLSP